MIKAVADFYVNDGDKVADVTYGKGAFWRKCDLSRFDLYPSDLRKPDQSPARFKRMDFTKLDYMDSSFNHLVLDPPYIHNPGNPIVNGNYGNRETTAGMYHDDIIELYRAGMTEARRVIVPGGQLWVKCQDEIESGRQKCSHIEIRDIAIDLGFSYKDLFVLTNPRLPVVQHRRQLHARKNHSFLWVFQKAKWPAPRD